TSFTPIGSFGDTLDRIDLLGPKLVTLHPRLGVRVYDVSDPAAPALVGAVGGDLTPWRPRGVSFGATSALLWTKDTGSGNNGTIRVLDVQASGALKERSALVTPGSGAGAAFANDRLVALTSRGITTYDLADPAHP